MEKINEANLRAVLRRINEATGEAFNLERWAPGDGCTRYRVESMDGSRHPFGARYWLGRTEAYWGLHTIMSTLEWAHGHREHTEACSKGKPFNNDPRLAGIVMPCTCGASHNAESRPATEAVK